MQKFLFRKTANSAKEWLQKKIPCLLFQKYYEKRDPFLLPVEKKKCKTIVRKWAFVLELTSRKKWLSEKERTTFR